MLLVEHEQIRYICQLWNLLTRVASFKRMFGKIQLRLKASNLLQK